MTSALLQTIGDGLRARTIAPYLGPEVLALDGEPPIPLSTRGLAQALTSRIGVPGRIRGNLWASAQYVETFRHRQTLTKLMVEIFAPPPTPTALHHWLAGLNLPLIVDTWYDSTMAAALDGKSSWGQVQGNTKSSDYKNLWTLAYDSTGAYVPDGAADSWDTVLYKPHGSVRPANNFLVSDADYVEVLAEIDIQSPIPGVVQSRRTPLGFVFLGCRFHDQLLRNFARQIIKRSTGPYWAVLPGELSRNEAKFLDIAGIQRLDMPLGDAVAAIMAG